EDDFDFLTSNKVWIATDRSRARRCVEACVYGTLDFVGYPRFPAPVEFIAAVIAYYRSEERRVGKECRSRWSAGHLKKSDQQREGPSGLDGLRHAGPDALQADHPERGEPAQCGVSAQSRSPAILILTQTV